jgi:hypothetical protein
MWGEWRYSSTIRDLLSRWWGVVSFTPLPLYPGERAHGTHCVGGWVDPRDGLDDVEMRTFLILPGLEFLPPRSCSFYPSRSLYRLRHPASELISVGHENTYLPLPDVLLSLRFIFVSLWRKNT